MKIALVGSCPSSLPLVPFDDLSWEIWACSHTGMGLPRVDVFFELHAMAPMARDETQTLFLAWVAKHKKSYLLREDPRFKNAIKFPAQELIDQYGRWFFASSISWMFAFAISKKPTHIGLWGVDMSATEEYQHQRLACQFFIFEARRLGIEVVIPPESDIGHPLPLYGYQELDPVYIKLNARKDELSGRLKDMERQGTELVNTISRLRGALDDNEYQMRTFVQGPVNDPDEQEGAGGTVTALRRRETS